MTKLLLALTLLLAGLSTTVNAKRNPTDGGQQSNIIKCGKPVCG